MEKKKKEEEGKSSLSLVSKILAKVPEQSLSPFLMQQHDINESYVTKLMVQTLRVES